jgi:hypothetical protein
MAQSNAARPIEQGQMSLDLGLGKEITANFDGGDVCSDGGLLLLRKADDRTELCEFAALAFPEKRRPDLVQHSIVDMLRQRVYAIAAGYEDCNDANSLSKDRMHLLAVGKPLRDSRLASQPTLSRFEGTADATVNAYLQDLLVHQFIRSKKKPPKVVRLAMDTTCDEVFGFQQMSFWNGYYQAFCYAPLFIFSDCGFPVCALLRPGNPSPIDDALRMLKRIIPILRKKWPKVRIKLAADAAFASPEIFEFCERSDVTYYIAAAGHPGLTYHARPLVEKCKQEFDEFGYSSPDLKPHLVTVDPKQRQLQWRQSQERIRYSSKEEGRMQEHFEDDLQVRKYSEFKYQSKEWTKERRFVFRCHYTAEGPDVRYVVTNQAGGKARRIYDDEYCPRSQCENWIKDLKTYLKCDRTSCQEFEANQLRLFLHTFAYILIWSVRTAAKLRQMTVHTFQLRMLRIGVIVSETARQVRLLLASNHPAQAEFVEAWNSL